MTTKNGNKNHQKMEDFMCKATIKMAVIIAAGAVFFSSADASDRYVADFEQPTFQPGTLPGITMDDGQDGWLITADLYHEPNYGLITVQDRVARTGRQAVEFSAAGQDIDYAHLRRNVIFSPMPEEPYVFIDLDIFIADNSNRSGGWGLDIQSGLMTRVTKWLISNDNSVKILDPAIDDWRWVDFTFAPNTWHHTSTAVDFNNMTVSLSIDGELVTSVGIIDDVQDHAFTSIYLENPGADTLYFDNFSVTSTSIVGIDDDGFTSMPAVIELAQNYPNPFNAETAIRFNLMANSNIRLEIFDILGRKIETLAEGFYHAGAYNVVWNADAYPSGVYFYVLTTGQKAISRQMTFMK